jgi:hypothetical protein
MVLKLNRNLTIENLGHFPKENVDRLRGLLASGVRAQADEQRANFYEVESETRVFWIHVSPVDGHVILLAVWQKPGTTTNSQAA